MLSPTPLGQSRRRARRSLPPSVRTVSADRTLGGKTTKFGFKNTKKPVFSPCEQKHTKNTVQYKRPAERARGGALVRHVTCAQTRGRTPTRIAPRARVRPSAAEIARRRPRPCRGRSRHLQQHWSRHLRQQFKRHLHLHLHLLVMSLASCLHALQGWCSRMWPSGSAQSTRAMRIQHGYAYRSSRTRPTHAGAAWAVA